MQLIEDLRADHDLIDQVLGSLRAFVAARVAGGGNPAAGPVFMAFFRDFAGACHHAKEEDILFRALSERAELPADRGPIWALTLEHQRMAGVLAELAGLLEAPLGEGADRLRLQALAVDYSRSLWHHIDAENSVMFPEGQEHLRRFHILELPAPPMTEAQLASRDAGAALVAAYPPQPDPEVIRGDGCMGCPSYLVTCEGLEREWWTDLAWEDFEDRMSSD